MLLQTYPVLKIKRIACWNVRTLYSPTGFNDRQTARLNEELKRLNIDIVALSETRLSGSGSLREKDYTTFWQGKGEHETREHGVGSAIKNEIMPYMETPLGLSATLMSAKVHTKNGYMHLLSVYAPTLQSKDEDKDIFYNRLDEEIRKVPRKGSLLVLGDFNARVGSNFDHWLVVLGREGVGRINENGQRLLELCSIQQLAVTNTYFAGKLCWKTSWMHPRSKHWHQIDLILTRQRDLREIYYTKTYQSADCDTDHSLVCAKINISLKK